MKVVIYTRISRDGEGAGLGVERQEEDCRAYCKKRGWKDITVFTDNNITGMGSKKRPDYERMISDVKAGKFSKIVTWHLDRITRSPKDLEELIELIGDESVLRVEVHSLNGGVVDLTSPEGRMQVRIMANISRYYVEHNRVNNLRARRQIRKDGLYQGNKTGYGWRKVSKGIIEQVPEEAPYVAAMYEMFLAGKSPSQIADYLNDNGQVTRAGNPWYAGAVRQVLRHATNAGLLEEIPEGEKAGNSWRPMAENIIEGKWEGIISRETWEKAVIRLCDRSYSPARGTRSKTLLSNIMTCGQCGEKATVNYRSAKEQEKLKGDTRRYMCRNGHISLKLTEADDYVVPVVLAMVRESGTVRNASTLRAELKRYAVKRDELANSLAADDITQSEYVTASRVLREREEMTRTKLGSLQTDNNAGTRKWWDGLDLEEKRAVIRATASLTLMPYDNARHHPKPKERIKIVGK
jgi:site-specific DNA recombinase